MRRFCLALLLCLLVLPSLAAAASGPQQLLSSKGWRAFASGEGKARVCYMVLHPAKSEATAPPKPVAKGAAKEQKVPPAKPVTKAEAKTASFTITFRPSESAEPVISYAANYAFKKESEVTLKVDGTAFALFTNGRTAWARGNGADRAVAEAVRKGKIMGVGGVTESGAARLDGFVLAGAGEAYQAIAKGCGVSDK